MSVTYLARLTAGYRPIGLESLSNTIYNMPMCSPESASRCDAPAFLKADTVSFASPLLSPVRKALSSGAVPSFSNGSVSI